MWFMLIFITVVVGIVVLCIAFDRATINLSERYPEEEIGFTYAEVFREMFPVLGSYIGGLIATGIMVGVFGGVGYLFFDIFASIFEHPDEVYDDTPSEWGPGVDNPSIDNFHEVHGENGNYLRSNPDNFTNNNINP